MKWKGGGDKGREVNRGDLTVDEKKGEGNERKWKGGEDKGRDGKGQNDVGVCL